MQLSISTLLLTLATLSYAGVTQGGENVKSNQSMRGASRAYVSAQSDTAYSFQNNGNRIIISGVPGTAVVSLGRNGQGNAVAIGGGGSAIAVGGNSNGQMLVVAPHGRKLASSLRTERIPTIDMNGLQEYFSWLSNILDATALTLESELDDALYTSER